MQFYKAPERSSIKFYKEPNAAVLETTLLGPLMKGYNVRAMGPQEGSQQEWRRQNSLRSSEYTHPKPPPRETMKC